MSEIEKDMKQALGGVGPKRLPAAIAAMERLGKAVNQVANDADDLFVALLPALSSELPSRGKGATEEASGCKFVDRVNAQAKTLDNLAAQLKEAESRLSL